MVTPRRFDFSRGDLVASRMLTSDAFIADNRRTSYRWECVECGRSGIITQINLKQSTSCCNEFMHRGRDMLRVVWDDMHNRCYDFRHPQFSAYGGRGIRVSGWDSYLEFKTWALSQAYKYADKLDLDRENNDAGYSPENCRFVSRSENSRNRRSTRSITAFGVTRTLSDWADRAGLQAQTVAARIDRYGWSPERAVTTTAR